MKLSIDVELNPQEEFDYLRSQGYTGALNDMRFAFLSALGFKGAINDKLGQHSGVSSLTTLLTALASTWDGTAMSSQLGDFTVPSGATAPTLSGDKLIFDGVDDRLSLVTPIDLEGKTVVAVFKPLSTPAIAAQDSAVCFYASGSKYAQLEARGATVWEQRHRHAGTGISGSQMDTVTLGNARVDVTDTDTIAVAIYESDRAVVVSSDSASVALDVTSATLDMSEIRIGFNRVDACTAMEFYALYIVDSVDPADIRPVVASASSTFTVAHPNITQFVEKDVMGIGDSIVVGVGDSGENGFVDRASQTILADNLDRTSMALAGAQMSPYGLVSPGDDSIIAVCASNITATATYATQDLLVISYGTNDFNNDVPIGTVASSDPLTFYGAANVAMNAIDAEGTFEIVLCTPSHRTSETTANAAGHTLEDYRVAIRAIGARHNITVVEMGTLWDDATNAANTTDGLHPNDAGAALMASQLVTTLEGTLLVPAIVANTAVLEQATAPVLPDWEVGDVLSYAAISEGTYTPTGSVITPTVTTKGVARSDGYVFTLEDLNETVYTEAVVNGALSDSFSLEKTVAQDSAALVKYGVDPDYDGGTTFDYYVDPRVVSSGAGTSTGTAFKTVEEAITQVVADGVARTIGIMSDEWIQIDYTLLSGFTGSFHAYSTDKPILTASEAAPALTACDATHDGDLGTGHTDTYFFEVDPATIRDSDPKRANLHINGLPMPIAQRSLLEDRLFRSYGGGLIEADTVNVDGSGNIIGYTDADVFPDYTLSDLADALVFFRHSNNNTTSTEVATLVGDTITLVDQSNNNDLNNHNGYNLLNMPEELQDFEWAWRTIDASTVRFYVKCSDPTAVSTLRYVTQDGGFDILPTTGGLGALNPTGAVGWYGIRFKAFSGAGGADSCCPIRCDFSSDQSRDNMVTIQDCEFSGCDGYTFNSRGGISLESVNGGFLIERCYFHDMPDCFGLQISGSDDGVIRSNYFYRTARAGARPRSSERLEFSYNFFDYVGAGSHANVYNFYANTNEVLCYGNKVRRPFGYTTFQDATNLYWAFNETEAVDTGNSCRAIVEQVGTGSEPDFLPVDYFWNNTVFPPRSDPTENGGFELGDDDSALTLRRTTYMWNNVTPTGGLESGALGEKAGNVYTNAAATVEASGLQSSNADVYVPIVSGEGVTEIKADSDLATFAGVDVSAAIAAAQLVWPSFDFTKDADGNDIVTGMVGATVPPDIDLPGAAFGITYDSTSPAFDDNFASTPNYVGGSTGFTVTGWAGGDMLVVAAARTLNNAQFEFYGTAGGVTGTNSGNDRGAQANVGVMFFADVPAGDVVVQIRPRTTGGGSDERFSESIAHVLSASSTGTFGTFARDTGTGGSESASVSVTDGDILMAIAVRKSGDTTAGASSAITMSGTEAAEYSTGVDGGQSFQLAVSLEDVTATGSQNVTATAAAATMTVFGFGVSPA